jgi:uncharacterized delta-60 repeat protein
VAVDSGLARFLADGSLDTSYSKPVFSTGAAWQDVLADGRAYVSFASATNVNGSPAPQQVMRFNADGTADAGFAPGVFQTEMYPGDMTILGDGRLLTWGSFDTVGTSARIGAARFNRDGSLDASYALSGVKDLLDIGGVGALADGRLFALVQTGTSTASASSTSLARFSATGAVDPSYVPDSMVVSQARSMLVLPDAKVLVWSAPTAESVFSQTPVFLKRLGAEGAVDSSFVGLSAPDSVFGAVYSDRTAPSIVQGDFNILGRYADGRLIAAATQGPYPKGTTALNYTLLRLNANGTLDTSFVAPVVTQNKTLQVQTGSTLLQNYTITASLGSPFNGVLPQADGSVIVYGTGIGTGIARLTASGALDTTFSAGLGAEIRAVAGRTAQIHSVALDPQGRYWVSGLFDTFGGQNAPGLVRLKANGSVDSTVATPLSYQSYGYGKTRVLLDGASRPLVLGTYLPSADGYPDAIHRLLPSAVISALRPALTVGKAGAGAGMVVSTPAAINCGVICGSDFDLGTVVSMTATPASGSVFAGWRGDCSGTGACRVTMNKTKNVAATFKPTPFTSATSGVVAGTITDAVATVKNTIVFNTEDVGKKGSVYVTAVIPSSNLARLKAAGGAPKAMPAGIPLETTDSSNLVLVQLTSTGWQPVVNGQLIPYATGVLGDQLAAQNILSNTATAGLAGAQFCVGYGTSAEEMDASGRMQVVASVADTTAPSAASLSCLVTDSLQVATGWNLLGNSREQGVLVNAFFSEPAWVTSVWKWDGAAKRWQFFAPNLEADALTTYASSQGFDVLSEIRPGEGYWVNTSSPASVMVQSGSPFDLPASSLGSGWNLVSTGTSIAPAAFNSSKNLGLTSLWAWDSALQAWYFYAPSLEAQGASALASYISANGYLDFTSAGKTLGAGVGFWVNKP